MQLVDIANKVAAAVMLALLGGVAWLYLIDKPDAAPSIAARSAGEQTSALVTRSPGSRVGTAPPITSREISPASDLPWRAPDVDAELLDTLLDHPVSILDIFDTVEWAETNAWIGVPDIGGQWSMARRQCAAEKLGAAFEEPCYYNVNLVLRRRADGNGEVVGAIADFGSDIYPDDPNVHGPDPSLATAASARCRNFARCLVARGYGGMVAPLAPGPEGELISLQFMAREMAKPANAAEARQWLESAINATLAQIELHERDPLPGDLGYEFNLLTLRRALEYYKWLLTQVES